MDPSTNKSGAQASQTMGYDMQRDSSSLFDI